jgi:WD40 repeat protein
MNPSEFKLNLAVVIGINDYRNGVPTLGTARQDAEVIADILKTEYQYQVHLITDTTTIQATSKNLQDYLETELPEILKKANPSRLLFYFAGHGIALNGDDGLQGYLIPQDAKLGDVSTYIPMQMVEAVLTKLSCRHCLVILDCCFAGAFRWSSTRKLVSITETIHKERYDRFIQDPAWQVITSAASDQCANDSLDIKGDRGIAKTNTNHSPFAAALMDALSGKADAYPVSTNGKPSGDGVITATELYMYLRDAVEPATEEQSQRQTPGLWPLKNHDKGEYIFLAPGHPLNLPPAPPLDESKNPYRGLESFEEEHSDFFFGRTASIEKLYEFVSNHTLTVVLGASGSGKSSLVKAGLVTFMKQQLEVKSNPQWQILAPFRPGESPLKTLNNILAREKLAGASITQLGIEEKVASLSSHLAAWSQQHPNQIMLLVIDQFEELITLCKDEQEREQFLALLAEAVAKYPKQLRLVLTLRSDFEPQFRETALKNDWNDSRFVVSQMTRADLREAIEKPAEKRVMYFEPHELVEQLIDEVADMPGALPLLSFGLSELYLKYLRRQRDAQSGGRTIDRSLTQADYQSMGGIIQSLTQRADEEYEVLVREDPAYAQVIRQVMLRMVAIGGGELARRQVPLSELEYPTEKNGLVKEVIERFTNARLLVKGEDLEGKSYVEPAHDALVRGWKRLLEWKQEEEESLLLQRRLTPAAQEWESFKNKDKEQPKGILAQVTRLLRRSQNQQERSREKPVQFLWNANPYLDVLAKELNSDDNWFNQVEAEFVQQSVLQKRRNISWRWQIAIAVILGLSWLTITAYWQWQRSEITLVQQSNALANYSEELFNQKRKFDALIEGLRAAKPMRSKKNPSMQVILALRQAVYEVRERNRLQEHRERQDGNVVFSPDGKTLAYAGDESIIYLWDVATGKERQIPTQGSSSSIVFSPDGKTLASAGLGYGGTIKLWDVSTGKQVVQTIFVDIGYLSDVVFSPDSKILAFGGENKKNKIIKLLDITTGTPLQTLTGKDEHDDRIFSITFSPDGKTLASGSQKIQIWDVTKGKPLQTLTGHSGVVNSVAFSPKGELLASKSNDKTIRLWDVTTGKSLKIFTGRSNPSDDGSAVFSPDGKILASGDDNSIKLWDVTTGTPLQTLTGHSSVVNSVVFSPDGKILASSSQDKTIRLWDVTKNKLLQTPTEKDYAFVNSVAFSPDGKILAEGNENKTIKFWDASTGKLLRILTGHSSVVNSVVFSPDGKTLASGSDDNTIKIWDTISGNLKQTLAGHEDTVQSVAFSPDGKTLASGSDDNTIKIWDTISGNLKQALARPESFGFNSVAFSPNGKTLASGNFGGSINLWDIRKGIITDKPLQTLAHPFRGNNNLIQSVAFSPDGKTLASAGNDNTIMLWNIATGKPLHTLTEQTYTLDLRVKSVAFSLDGKTLVSGSDDGTIKLWDTATGTQLHTLSRHSNSVNSLAFSSDGKTLASGSTDTTVILWNFDLDDLLVRGCDWAQDYLKNNPKVIESDRHLCD